MLKQLFTPTGKAFDELHITPEGSHWTESDSVKACAEGCCWESDRIAFEWSDLSTTGFTIISDDNSGCNFPLSAFDEPVGKFSCGCPVWWDLADGIMFPHDEESRGTRP